MLGLKFGDKTIQDNSKIWPFEVVEGENSRPMVKLKGVKDVPE